MPDPTVKPDPEGRITGELPSPVFPPSGLPVPHPLPQGG